ncbi:metallophosphoesterase family protein [Candidatus Poribacteria bacterium]|nr:metallophosphoesterase family protein [Candidatus Poribacteria bacterium]MBT5534365.1 metallophosphoesterase family protein [Candidatus Poribacteria bacterium]MBT7096989.1 metallophosphoesterase family protein [Candidatus Poribacteria bacterium]MBT7805458.1 metallophosphoesterase family protein [Candidatus Poribacteria bacterium]
MTSYATTGRRARMSQCWLLGTLLVLVAARSALAVELRRGPYLLNQRPDGITARWRTGDAVRHTSVLRYGETPYVLDHAVAAERVRQHFPGLQDWEATVVDLAPDTKYYYAIEGDQVTLAGADERTHFRTAPASTSPRKLRFWFLGDSGSNRPREGETDTVLQITGPTDPVKVRNGFRRFSQRRGADGIILLGDNAYPWGSDAEYQTAFFGIYRDDLANTPLWPGIGNHDMDDAYRHIFFTTPREGSSLGLGSQYYYSFDLANVHFVMLDAWKSWWEVTTDPDYIPWQRELAWLREDLASTRQTWTIVVCHFPLYCDGNYDSDTNGPLKLLREALVPILDRFGVDLYLAGHDHTYQRSYLIRGHTGTRDSFREEDHLVSAADGRSEPILKRGGPNGGTVHIVSGTGGGTRPNGAFAHPVMVPFQTEAGERRGLAQPGSLALAIEASALEGWQIDIHGQPVDHFRMEKVAP